MVAVSLVTLGSPDQVTGGYLYHRRLADVARRYGAQVRFVSFPEGSFLVGVRRAGEVIAQARSGDTDVIVVDSIVAGLLAPWLATHRLDEPLVAVLHQPPGGIDHGPWATRIRATLDRSTYRRARRLIAASQALADELEANGLPRHHIRVVPPGRDVARDREGPIPDLRGDGRRVFLCVGNWVARKGIIELLEAFSRLPPEAGRLHLVGDRDKDDSYAARVTARMDEADLRGRVIAHGAMNKERVAAFYAAADVFVLPSWKEPYGTVYGEAMAAGLPVVGWRAGNLVNLAEDGQEGSLVPPGDVGGLTAAMRELAFNDAHRLRLAASARQRAQSLPTWEDTGRLFFSNLREVLCESQRD